MNLRILTAILAILPSIAVADEVYRMTIDAPVIFSGQTPRHSLLEASSFSSRRNDDKASETPERPGDRSPGLSIAEGARVAA